MKRLVGFGAEALRREGRPEWLGPPVLQKEVMLTEMVGCCSEPMREWRGDRLVGSAATTVLSEGEKNGDRKEVVARGHRLSERAVSHLLC